MLYEPFDIGNVRLPNRFVMTGIGSGLPAADGSVTDEYIAYFAERAKGGAGLLITEVVRVCDGHGLTARYQLSAAHDDLVPGIKRLTDAIHVYDSKIFLQLHHPGRETFDEILNGISAVAPSAIPCPVNRAATREITIDEIKELTTQFGQAAYRARQGGADGVELHGAHGYLIHQFLSPWTNRRADGYGGNFKNRFRFLKELIESIRKECGSDFPIAVRFPMEDFMGDRAIDIELGIRIARQLEKAGVDLLDATVGLYETGISNMLETAPHHQGWRNELLARLAEEEFSIPLMAVNSTRSLAFAEWMAEHRMADLIGMGRPFLADPEWVNKARDGRSKEIRPCLSCVYCVESLRGNAAGDDERNTCAVNARTYNELKYPVFHKNGAGRPVAVVGAGPAGMECALTLAERGFDITLYEKSGRVGGQLNLAARPKDKYRIEGLVEFYETMLKRKGVHIVLNKEIVAESSELEDAEAIFVSTGSVPIVPKNIAGTDLPNVYSVSDILEERVRPRNSRIAVVGSGLTGLETAEYLAARSNVVFVFEMLDAIGKDIYFQHREDVLDALRPYAVDFYPSHQLTAIEENMIEVKDLMNNSEHVFPVDGVVLSLGMKPEDTLYRALTDSLKKPVVPLGDTVSAGRIKQAVHTGFHASYVFA
jgi:2,4-dienoyl-CoA reductase-like NADH-dependent reductase (Old Yellow Enzyme family)/NADPH-dependent 2,4-dienoyl-CoA reductase/sulfur reductase-like enzyme